MSTRVVTFAQLGPMLGDMLRRGYRAAIIKGIQNAVFLHAPRIIQEEIANTHPHQPVDRGTYKGAWQAEAIDNGAALYNPLPYAAVIEHGRRPGRRQPPPQVLIDWIVRKGLQHDSGRPLKDYEIKGLAYVIGRKISEKGIPPKKVLERTMERLDPIIFQEIRKAVEAMD